MPGPGKKQKPKKPKAQTNASGQSSGQSSGRQAYVPSTDFLDNVYHAEGWSAQADVLCDMLQLPDISSRSGLKRIYKNFETISRKLNDIYEYGRANNNDSLAGTVIAVYAKMSADAVLRDRIFNEADFLQKITPLLDNTTCYHVALHSLCAFTHHAGRPVRLEIAKKTPFLLQLLEEQPTDIKATELTITTISHSVGAVVGDEAPPDSKYLKFVDMPRLLRVVLSIIKKPQTLILPTNILFEHALSLVADATMHCSKDFHAFPDAIDFLVACTRSTDIRVRADAVAGILRLHISAAQKDDTNIDPMKMYAAIQRGWPPRLNDMIIDYGFKRSETYLIVTTAREFQDAMMKVVQDQDLYGLGLKLSEYILRTEYSITQGAWQVEDPRTGRRATENLGLPFTMWMDALPHCAKAIRARGSASEADKADILDLKFLIMKSRMSEAHTLARKAITRNPNIGFYYYVLTLGAPKAEGLRTAKKGLKCPDLTGYVRFGLLYRAAEHATDLALQLLREAVNSGKDFEEGFAFAMSALEDTTVFMNEAPPDTRSMKSVIYIHVLMSLLVRGHEMSADLRDLQDAKSRLDKADEFAKFMGKTISKTQMRLACMTFIDRMQNAWKEWGDFVTYFSDPVRREISPAKAEDDLAAWLERLDIEDPDAVGFHDRNHGHVTHPSLNLNDVELYRCSWCRNPSANLKKCGGCAKTRYCDPACQKQHWSGHRKICKQ
ncbi:hypothetical protein EWM64_g5600 [Hericium alpestre]|uniref:MYND-type domain-containing protein n=1 Tax=Hericium alpestre TaxID=135208 RepID=A0A4Y9ZW48_9AGAM|nr:hypothetical protein EWM64_g5600 [Hericium alpestre]